MLAVRNICMPTFYDVFGYAHRCVDLVRPVWYFLFLFWPTGRRRVYEIFILSVFTQTSDTLRVHGVPPRAVEQLARIQIADCLQGGSTKLTTDIEQRTSYSQPHVPVFQHHGPDVKAKSHTSIKFPISTCIILTQSTYIFIYGHNLYDFFLNTYVCMYVVIIFSS